MRRMQLSFATKMITTGVLIKAVLMGAAVSLLAVTSFEKSVALVLISASATGIFGIIIVLIQTHSEARLHDRIDHLESRADQIVEKSDIVKEQTQVIAEAVKAEET
jgi:hypothetical protein